MTKSQFFKEVKDMGVDLDDKRQMRVWTLALLAMAQNAIDHKFERCENCHYAKPGLSGKDCAEKCLNMFCPVKKSPDNPEEMVEYMFDRDEYFDLREFYRKYVSQILNKLIEMERNAEDAKNENS